MPELELTTAAPIPIGLAPPATAVVPPRDTVVDELDEEENGDLITDGSSVSVVGSDDDRLGFREDLWLIPL